MSDYKIIQPNEIFRGKTYSDMVEDWFNWFLSANADDHNQGPVVFLRSAGIPKSGRGPIESSVGRDENQSDTLDEANYSRKYVNEPNVRIGADRLQIFDDQAVLVPCITAFAEASKPSEDWGTLQEFVGLTIDYGDNPPENDQLTIDSEAINIDLKDFRILTPIFTAIVPDAPYGASIKDFLEMPLSPGQYPAMVDGYFVLIQFTKPGTYVIHSWASAPREIRGPYFSQLIYQVEVNRRPKKDSSRGAPGFRLARDEGVIADLVMEKLKRGELTLPDAESIGNAVKFDVVSNYRKFTELKKNRRKPA